MSLLQPTTEVSKVATQTPPKKKGRGRPRKHKEDVPKLLKKRGRKKKIEKQIYNLNNLQEIHAKSKEIIEKSILVHLPINIKDFEKNNNKMFEHSFLNYDPLNNLDAGIPQGFDLGTDFSTMNVEPELIDTTHQQNAQGSEYKLIDNNKNISKKINNIMMEFSNFNDKKFFQTDICCWHCCHKFESMPCGIPHSIEEGLFKTKGVFCSFNCALTYNYNSKQSENQIQERESLLYLMYKRIHNVKEVELKYAPDKETLKMFGGILTIEEFRQNQNTYVMVYPPMLSIIPQLEEIKILGTITSSKLVLNNPNKVKAVKKNSILSIFRKK